MRKNGFETPRLRDLIILEGNGLNVPEGVDREMAKITANTCLKVNSAIPDHPLLEATFEVCQRTLETSSRIHMKFIPDLVKKSR